MQSNQVHFDLIPSDLIQSDPIQSNTIQSNLTQSNPNQSNPIRCNPAQLSGHLTVPVHLYVCTGGLLGSPSVYVELLTDALRAAFPKADIIHPQV